MEPGKAETRRVLLAQSGDPRALDELFRSVQQPLFRCLSGILGDPALAEDALQEVFVRIHRKLGTLREPSVFLPWAYRIATRHAFRVLKRERRWRERVSDDSLLDNVPAEETRPDPEWLEHLPAMVAEVSPASRAVLVLHYLEGLALKEIAAVLDLSLGTVKSRLAYGLASLRRNVSSGHP